MKYKIKVYMDTCILSRILDQRISDKSSAALGQLCNYDLLNFTTSQKTLEEFLNANDDKKRVALKLLYKIITKIPSESLLSFQPALFNTVMFNQACFNGGFKREDPLFAELKQVFDIHDAEHIFQAVKGKCDYFLTLDYKTILNRVTGHQNKLVITCQEMKFVDPVELLNLVQSN